MSGQVCHLSLHVCYTEVMIGFDPTEYTVSESSGEALLSVVIQSGSLERPLTVRFATIPDSATEAGTVTLEMVEAVEHPNYRHTWDRRTCPLFRRCPFFIQRSNVMS